MLFYSFRMTSSRSVLADVAFVFDTLIRLESAKEGCDMGVPFFLLFKIISMVMQRHLEHSQMSRT